MEKMLYSTVCELRDTTRGNNANSTICTLSTELAEASRLLQNLRGEIRYIHETSNVQDSVRNSADLLEEVDKFLLDMGMEVDSDGR